MKILSFSVKNFFENIEKQNAVGYNNKRKERKKMRDNKGITLIALVTTIIVLLILTAVVLRIAFDNNSIFGNAKKAATQTMNFVDYEANKLGEEMKEAVENGMKVIPGN